MNETVATYYSFIKQYSLMFFVDEMNVALSYHLCLLNRVGREKVGVGEGVGVMVVTSARDSRGTAEGGVGGGGETKITG